MSSDPTMMMMMSAGLVGMLSLSSSAAVYLYKDTLCSQYPSLSFLCPAPPTDAPTEAATTDAPTTAPATSTTGSGTDTTSGTGSPRSAGTLSKRFSPYVLLSNSALGLVGSKSKWTTLAFVVGYANKKISWDAGTIDAAKLKTRIDTARKSGGVIVSFGGASAGKKTSKYYSELAGKYTDPQKLADAYIAIADALKSTWLDFDVEGDALKNTAAIDRRNKAIYLVQKKRTDMRISFTVPVGLSGLGTTTKSMLSKAKNAGVRIDVVNLMTMYFTTPTSAKPSMSAAVLKAVSNSKAFITSLGAKVGITPQIGKNPDKPYTHELFTTGDASRVVTAAKNDADVALLSFWSLNNDSAKYSGAYATAFKAYA